ncbi:hypothetical protein [Pseudoxanthomonas suwonensis]|uniref:Transmembrane protein n=1 Tax=Pseudoxanthomonas suwonensis TaxID=314722 RepID=A0A0E3Z1I0_9GAMM|nr:hypothetical protein [Pseudoxanthomonas suwonensis]AKC87089.1 hypothetical protein WQ53_10380 [Pseudoxanthomonas suwonensis]
MRTLVLIVVGLLLAGVSMWLARPASRPLVAGGFAVAWLAVVLWNLRTGLSHGYTLVQELPIQLLIFVAPVALAAWLAFKVRGH